MKKTDILTIVVLGLWLAGSSSAQLTTGTISGTVKDSTGALMPGTKIVVLNQDTGIPRTVEADAAGHYSATSLGLGKYQVTATRDGFQTQVRSGIVLTVGQEAVIDMVLTVGAVNQTVEVTAEASAVETTTSSVSALVAGEQIRELPLNGRSVDSLALLTPGVLVDHTALNAASLGEGVRMSVNGGRFDAMLYLLDGTIVNDQGGGGPGSADHNILGVEGILEFRLLSHNFSAEYGRVGGAVMSMVTRSGSNDFHGTAYEFLRNSVFDARNFFNPGALPPFRRNQFGGSLGGRIIKDRVFFFANYEGLRAYQGVTINIAVPDLNARKGLIPSATTGQLTPTTLNPAAVPFVNLYPLPDGVNYGDGTAQYLTTFSTTIHENYALERMDFRLTDKDNLYWRYVYNPSDILAPRPTPSWAELTTGHTDFVTISETHIFSGASVNDFRVAYNRTDLDTEPITLVPVDPSVTLVPGQGLAQIQFSAASSGRGQISELGSSSTRPQNFPQNLFQESDTFSSIRGAHSLKFGVDVVRIQINQQVGLGSLRGKETFGGLTALLAGTPSTLAITPVSPNNHFDLGWRRAEFGWFVVDDYRIRPNLTVNLGLRQDIFLDPNEVNGSSGNLLNLTDPAVTNGVTFVSNKKTFSPRIGLAWDPTGSGKTSVRVGAGLYYTPLDGRNYYVGSAGVSSLNLSIKNPSFPFGLAAGAVAGLQALTVIPYHPDNPTSAQYSLEVQRQLTNALSLRVGYLGSDSYHLQRQQQANTVIPTTRPDGSLFFTSGGPVPNPHFSTIAFDSTDARSNYNALQATLQKNLSFGLQFQAVYTWSKAMSNADEAQPSISAATATSTLNIRNLAQDYSLSVYDQRQKFVLNSVYQLPLDKKLNGGVAKAVLGGWALTGIYTFGSGMPFNIVDGFNNSANGDTQNPDRPNLNPGFSPNPVNGVTAGCAGVPAGQQLGTVNRWYDPCAFSLSPAGTFGNLGRNTVIGPRTNDVDFTLLKTTRINERMRLEFRWELFNLFNHALFGLPNLTAFTSARVYNGSAGNVTTTVTDNREMQFGLKLIF